MIDILGCIATVVVVISFTVKDMGWLRVINATGAMLWLIYGGLRNDIPLLAVNIAILMAHIHWYYKNKQTMAQQTSSFEFKDENARFGIRDEWINTSLHIGGQKQQTLQDIRQLAERMWEGCHGCDETDKQMWINGFVNGYLIAKSE
jgi:hypothetical protein